jgi:hypothetical protein
MKITEFDKKAVITSDTSATKEAYVPKGLSDEEKGLFMQLKSLPELKSATQLAEGVTIKFLILSRVKFVIAVSNGVITHQRQIFGVIPTEKTEIANETGEKVVKSNKGTFATYKISSKVPALVGYEWASKEALFFHWD